MSLDIARDSYTQNPAAPIEPDENIFNFNAQLKVSEEGEEEFISWANRQIQKGNMRGIQDLRNNSAAQKADIDFACFGPNGQRCTYEVKTDTTITGNLFAEYMVNTYNEDRQGNVTKKYSKLGWLYGSEADRVFYYFVKTRTVYVFDLPQFAAWVDSQFQAKVARTRRQFPIRAARNIENRNEPGRYYYGIGYLISLDEMYNAPMMRGHIWKIQFSRNQAN